MREALANLLFFTAWMVLHPIKAFRLLSVRLLSVLNGRRPLWDNKAMHPLLRALGFPKPSADTDNLPFMVTITTLTVSGMSDTEIAGYAADEVHAKSILELRVRMQLEEPDSKNRHIAREDNGTVMVHTDAWTKVFEVSTDEDRVASAASAKSSAKYGD